MRKEICCQSGKSHSRTAFGCVGRGGIKTGTLSNGTVENYLGTIRNIKKHPLAERKLKNVTSEHLQSFFDLLSFGGVHPDGKERKGYSKDYIHSFPQSCSSPSVLQYFQSSILRSIPCSILNCGIRRMKWICFPMRIWTEMSNQFHEKIMKDCLLICKKEPSRNTSNPDSLLCRASYWRSLRFGMAGRKSGRTMPYHKTQHPI